MKPKLFNELRASVKQAAAIERGEMKSARARRIPKAVTVRTLKASKTSRKVKRFGSKKELFADLGL